MLDVSPHEVDVVACLAAPDRCDAIQGSSLGTGVRTVRVAPDEVLLVTPTGSGGHLVGRAVALAGPHSVVEAVTDGWAALKLTGAEAGLAFEHLSRAALPAEGAVLADVVRVRCIVMAVDEGLVLLVPSMFGAHLRRAVAERCRHLLGAAR